MLERIVNSFREAKQAVKDSIGILVYPTLSFAKEKVGKRIWIPAHVTAAGFSAAAIGYSLNSGALSIGVLGAGVAAVQLTTLAGPYYVLKAIFKTKSLDLFGAEALEDRNFKNVLEIYARRNGRLAEYKSVLEGLAAAA